MPSWRGGVSTEPGRCGSVGAVWDPAVYQRYGDERARPFVDLLARVGAEAPTQVVDLGCGPGDQTATLLQRWPAAAVTGVDSSAEMLAAAAPRAVPGRLSFVHADLRSWRPPAPVDVVVSNATLQWVPDHLALLPSLAGMLAPGGWLALQVPGNFTAPSHTLLAEQRFSPRWREQVGDGADRAAAVHDSATYARVLLGLPDVALRVDAWETTYLHVLQGPDAVLEWTRGTALRPVLQALDDPAEREAFLAEYAGRLRDAYPAQEWGTPFPFRRIFVVAHRAERSPS